MASYGTILSLLLILMYAQANDARKMTYEESYLMISKNQDHEHEHSNKKQVDPSLNIFFTIKDLKLGSHLPIYFSTKNLSNSPPLLSREEANSIPFSTSNLPFLLKQFSFPKNSPQAKAMDYTLKQCELKPIRGETKFCSTSLESMLDSARETLGLNSNLKVLTTKIVKRPETLLVNYTILETPEEIFGGRGAIACHTMPYPYAVYYCHTQKVGTRLFQISLGGENGERVEAPAVCHMDTSMWNRDHAAFRVLRIEPGSSPVCHVIPVDNLLWVNK